MAKKNIYYWVFENPIENKQYVEITSQKQLFPLDLSSSLSRIIISNYEMNNVKKLNETKIKELQNILKK
jgi:hypothetical protein